MAEEMMGFVQTNVKHKQKNVLNFVEQNERKKIILYENDLHRSILNHDTVGVERCLVNEISPNDPVVIQYYKNKNEGDLTAIFKISPLQLAIILKMSYDTISTLIKYGANVNVNYNFDYPLAYAVASGNVKLTQLFINNGADLYITSGNYPSCIIPSIKPLPKRSLIELSHLYARNEIADLLLEHHYSKDKYLIKQKHTKTIDHVKNVFYDELFLLFFIGYYFVMKKWLPEKMILLDREIWIWGLLVISTILLSMFMSAIYYRWHQKK